jgi:perosamine synthetase
MLSARASRDASHDFVEAAVANLIAHDPALQRVHAARAAFAAKYSMREVGTRHLPPVYSPIPREALWGAVREEWRERGDPRPRFANRLCEWYRADSASLFGSGTEALCAAIVAARTIAGGNAPVALPAYACPDVAAAAVAAGARVALYDLDPDTIGPCLASLDAALNAGARVVVVAPLWGLLPEWDEIHARVAAHGGVVIEDAAQGIGSTWRVDPAGTHAALSVLSFGRGKGWTGGSGGAVLARGGAVHAVPAPTSPKAAHALAGIARVAAQRILAHPDLYALPASLPFLHLGETRYHRLEGTHPIASVAVRILERSREEALREAVARRRNARGYRDALESSGERQSRSAPRPLRVSPNTKPGYLRFPVRVTHGWRGLARISFALRAGVAPGYPEALSDIPEVRDRMALPTGHWHWPGAETLVREIVTLPTHSYVTAAERSTALQAIGA